MGSTPPPPADLTNPYDRVFVGENNLYDIFYPLGMIGVLKNGRLSFIDVPHVNCDRSEIAKSKVVMLPQTPALSSVLDNKSKGSLSFFTLSANLSDEERSEVTLFDVAEATLSANCALGVKATSRIAAEIDAAKEAEMLFYVTKAVLSHLVTRKYSKTAGGGQASAGSFLSVGADTYKGSDESVSVPLISVNGYRFTLAKPDTSHLFKTVVDFALPSGTVVIKTAL